MQVFNLGLLEIVFILIIALILFGPENMVERARNLGRWFYRASRSPLWRSVWETSQEIRDLPNKIVREAGIEELEQIRRQGLDALNKDIQSATQNPTIHSDIPSKPHSETTIPAEEQETNSFPHAS